MNESVIVSYIFNKGLIWESYQLVKLLNILQSMLNSMGIIWTGIILLERQPSFLLQEWKQNEFNNVQDIDSAVNSKSECELKHMAPQAMMPDVDNVLSANTL